MRHRRLLPTAQSLRWRGVRHFRAAPACRASTWQPGDRDRVWTTKGEKGARLAYARSADGGRSFTRATSVPGGDAAGNRGWEPITASADRAVVVWLDHLELAAQDSSAATMHHQHSGTKPDGVTVTTASDGSLQFAWRHVYPGAIRDIAFTTSRRRQDVRGASASQRGQVGDRRVPGRWACDLGPPDAAIVAWTAGRG